MYCRSLLLISRLNLKTSSIASRHLFTSCRHRVIMSSLQQQQQQLQKQQDRCLAQNAPNKRRPGRLRRFFGWFGWGAPPIQSTATGNSDLPPKVPLTTMQRVKQYFALAPPIERFFLRSRIIEDGDLARLLSKTAAITIYAFISISTLGTLGVDTKPLLAGIGVTGFTVGFALKEVATNFISGIFLVINKPFVRGCRIKIHGSGGGIEGLVHFIDIRYVHLKTKDRGIVMVPSAIVYTNPFTVFPVDDEANAGFIDMTKPSTTDPTKPSEESSSSSSSSKTSEIRSKKEKPLKMSFDSEPAGSFKRSPFNEKL